MENKKKKTKIKNKKINKLFLFASLLLVFLFAQIADAATLYPSPSSGSYDVGQSFSVGVFVASADQAMNAVSGALSFPTDKLEVSSVSTSGSVINLWVQQPVYSNSAGTVNFEGIVLNPGWTGSAGRIITVSFRTKAPGSAPVTFSSGSILANDGSGTSILEGLGSARFSIEVETTGPAAEEATTPPVTVGTPPGPQINSITHPDSDAWYAASIPEFDWSLPAGTTATRLLVGQKPQAAPTVTYVPAIGSKELESLDDGVWYFHVQLRNANGWGGVSHFRFQIDTQDPEYFNMERVKEDDLTNPTRSFIFDVNDATSGISHYTIQIDGGEAIEWYDEEEKNIYTTPALGPGRHTIIINALDKAGNFLTNVDEFVIDPLKAPTIIQYPEQLTNKDPFVIRGETYPNSQAVVWLQREATKPVNYIVKTDEFGRFTFVGEEKLRDGIYQMWAEVIDERGARSEPTEKFKILVQPTKLWQIGNMTIGILSIVVPLIALFFLLVFVVWFSWHKLRTLRKRVRVEAGEAQTVLHKEFKLLKRRIRSHITLLEKTSRKRKLTKEEEKVVKQLRKDLDYVEEKISKEIKDIQKEVK
jgi:hypothetical protein